MLQWECANWNLEATRVRSKRPASVEWLAVFAASTSNNQNRRKQLLSTWVEDHQLIYISSSFTEDSLVSPFLCARRLQTMSVDDTNWMKRDSRWRKESVFSRWEELHLWVLLTHVSSKLWFCCYALDLGSSECCSRWSRLVSKWVVKLSQQLRPAVHPRLCWPLHPE